jgi:CDP-diacylglycerol--glycerol-3-phosphate 3-phosphatidyltransferase
MDQAASSWGIHTAGSTIVSACVILILGGVVSAYAVRTALVGRRPSRRAQREGGTALLGLWLMEAFYWAARAPGRLFVRLGFKPDALTWTSLFLSLCAMPAAALGHFSTAGTFFLAGAAFDAFDGMVARQMGVASDAGEMLDAVIDRYADALPMLGLAIFYRFSVWQMLVPLAALFGSMMVSYNRAKSEAMGLSLPSGVMRRHERVAYVGAALVIAPELSPWLGKPYGAVHPATLVLVGIVALVANVAAIRLASAARRELASQGRDGGGTRT